MAADSRKVEEFTPISFETLEPSGEPRVEFSETTKLFVVRGIGCVSMWGDITRAQSKIAGFLRTKSEQFTGPSDLADSLLYFLKEILHAEGGDDIGFHVGGYMPNGTRALYHVFWGSDIGPEVDPENNPKKFAKYFHNEVGTALYNGKHFIADGVIRFLLALQQEVGIVSWITAEPPNVAANFADFVLRYAARIDQTVGGTANVAIILPTNKVILIKNPTTRPIPFIDESLRLVTTNRT